MAKIAIVGTRESGKTVLMTVLAKRYQIRNGDEPFLKAMNPQTMAFTEKNWHRLTVERDWPPLTPPGDLLKLHWSLECGGQSHEIHLVDFAGETFRTVFGKHTLTEPQVRSQLGADPLYGPLLAYLDQADVVVLLVNLRDYVNAPTTTGGMDLMLENQWALRGSLDYLAPRLKNHVAAVFTQIDQYPELVNNCKSWRDVMGEHLPATQIADIYGELACLGVSAIPETELDASPGGEPFQRPAANFQSWHLDELMYFLTMACKVIEANQESGERNAAERMRKEHINHEASVKAIGMLSITCGMVGIILGSVLTLVSLNLPNSLQESWTILIAVGIFLAGLLNIWVGKGHRRLKIWSRNLTAILWGFGTFAAPKDLAFVLLLLFLAYVLFLLYSPKGMTVFSSEYQRVINQTPHIKYRATITIWILIGLAVIATIVVFIVS